VTLEDRQIWHTDDLAGAAGDDYGHRSAPGIAHEVAGLLPGLPVTVRTADTPPTPSRAVARVVIDGRAPQARATDVCMDLLAGELADVLMEVEAGGKRTPSKALMIDQTQPHRRCWFVRLVPDEAYLCAQALGRPVGSDWEKVHPLVWVEYPKVWDELARHRFEAEVLAAVYDLTDHLKADRP